MSINDLLSQDEIDALVNGIETGSVKTELSEMAQHDGVARNYSLGSQDRIVRGRMPTLEMINQRFVRLFRITLFNMLRRSADVAAGEVQIPKFAEYVNSLYVPTSLNLVRARPLRGTGLIIFDPKLVFAVVNNYFGGDMRFRAKIEGREFTATEQHVIQVLLKQVFHDLKEAWGPVLTIDWEFVNSEVNPHLANIATPTEVVVVSSFHIDLGGDGGDLHVTMPYTMLEPLREILYAGLQSDRNELDERWANDLREEIKEAHVDIKCVLTETNVSLRELMVLKAGDIIPIEVPDHVEITAEGMPVLRGHYGVSRGSRAVKVAQLIRRRDKLTHSSKGG